MAEIPPSNTKGFIIAGNNDTVSGSDFIVWNNVGFQCFSAETIFKKATKHYYYNVTNRSFTQFKSQTIRNANILDN